MAEPRPQETPRLQAKLLRNLADRLERDDGPALPGDLEEALAREMEDRLDLEAVRAAKAEEGVVTLAELKAKLGLE